MTPPGASPNIDSRRARSEATRDALMRAAEKLIASKGIENTSIRHILQEANQKNTSALQYHFKNLNGLIKAIQRARSVEIQAKRRELLDELIAKDSQPNLRTICALMVLPVIELAREELSFRRYLKAFSFEPAMDSASALSVVNAHGGGGASGEQLAILLRNALPQLTREAYIRRLEFAVRQCSASIYHQARQPNAFRGDQAELFVNSLIDALEGLLSAPESQQTRAAAKRVTDSLRGQA